MSGSDDLLASAGAGDTRSIARLLSLVEDEPAKIPPLAVHSPAEVIGITGAPGVGKSTLTTALVAHYRSQGKRVAVLAIDPTSPFSGGAVLGDRIRMQQHTLDSGVFIRSMATRGHLGGLSAAVPHATRVLEAVGFEIVLIETVGVGQSEVEIAANADTTVVLLAPGMGDAVQAAKAGLLEIGDVYVVNKADKDGAEQTAKEIREAIALGGGQQSVVLASADRGGGIEQVAAAISTHRAWLLEHDLLAAKRRARTRAEIEAALAVGLRHQVAGEIGGLVERVERGEITALTAADQVLNRHLG